MNRSPTLGTIVVLALVLVLLAALSVQLPQGAAHAQDPERDAAPRQPAAPQAPLGTAASTPIGTSFTYQGQLLDGGNPADGEYDLRFDLYDAASGGNLLGTVTVPDQLVTAGLFTVHLDFGEVFTGTARFLEIGMRPGDSGGSFTTLTPRQELTPAPYALYAAAAPWSGLAGVPAGFADGLDNDTTYSPGFGLNLDGTTFHVVTSTIQQRVAGTCGVGSAIRVVNADGTAVCEPDDDTLYSPGFGLNLLGTTFHVVTSTIQQRVGATCGVGSAIRVVNTDGSVVCEPIGGSAGSWSLTGNSGTTPGTHFLGTTDGVSLVLVVSGTASLRLEPNAISPNLIGGHSSNNVAPGVVGATIGGGGRSGDANRVGADMGTIGGGSQNEIGDGSTGATIDGGLYNDIREDSSYATVNGGLGNNVSANNDYAAIGGGAANDIGRRSHAATIGGGFANDMGDDNPFATIGGGWENEIGPFCEYATIGGGFRNDMADSGYCATIGGGEGNRIDSSSEYTTIGGGRENHIGVYSGRATIGGGERNDIGARSDGCTIGGGEYNDIGDSTHHATIGGGFDNSVGQSSDYATVGGGSQNDIAGNSYYAAIGGGSANGIGSDSPYATIPGGRANEANGRYAFAAGYRAHADQQGAFVWADSSSFDFSSVVTDSFSVRATGGVTLVTGIDGSGVPNAGAVLPSGSGSWSMLSDRALKENLAVVDAQQLLARLAQVPITTWNYKAQDGSVRHMGPMAQDFYAAFGLGESQRHISAVDADGVALAAIQGLYAQNQDQTGRIAELEGENAALQSQVDNLEARLTALERGGASPSPAFPLPSWLLLGGLVLAGALVLQRRRSGGEG